MSDRRIDPTERPRDEGLWVDQIGKEKKEQEKYSPLPTDEEKNLLMASFFSYLKKMFDAFSPSKKFAGKVIDLQMIINHLEEFKNLLNKLRKQDLSNSAEYATALSDHWSLLLEDYEQFELMERKNLQEVVAFRNLLETVKNYPPDSEHRFGFYLLQHAGKDWLPFPFIEILEKIYKDHLDESQNSTLSKWTGLINKAIEGLKKGIPFSP